jgi:predicted transposase/invertase (TIGR01784 family)
MQAKYVNPFTDFGFKKIFGEEPNKELLMSFLNQFLPEHHRIKDLTYLKSEHLGISELDRNAMFDLYCESPSGEKFIVEMQKAKQNFFKDRSVYYATFPIQQQAKRGEGWKYELKAVYFVGILDFVFSENVGNEEVVHEVKLKNQAGVTFYDKLTFIYLEMPKFKKTLEESDTLFEKWLYVLKHLPILEERPAKLQEKVFTKLFETAKIAKFNQLELQEYQDSLKTYWDMSSVIETAFDEGQLKGKLEGMLEGEKNKAMQVAKNLLSLGVEIKTIRQATGLTTEEIKKLSQK